MEGIIRAWNFPRKMSQATKKLQVGQWNNSEDQKLEPIWQLLYYPERVNSSSLRKWCFRLLRRFPFVLSSFRLRREPYRQNASTATYTNRRILKRRTFPQLFACIREIFLLVTSTIISLLSLTFRHRNVPAISSSKQKGRFPPTE